MTRYLGLVFDFADLHAARRTEFLSHLTAPGATPPALKFGQTLEGLANDRADTAIDVAHDFVCRYREHFSKATREQLDLLGVKAKVTTPNTVLYHGLFTVDMELDSPWQLAQIKQQRVILSAHERALSKMLVGHFHVNDPQHTPDYKLFAATRYVEMRAANSEANPSIGEVPHHPMDAKPGEGKHLVAKIEEASRFFGLWTQVPEPEPVT